MSDERIEEFLSAGYLRQHVLEVVFAVAMKTLSNYVNHMAETPVDAQFMQQVWEPQLQSA
jgi:alkylhydroperoxidase family enzyme